VGLAVSRRTIAELLSWCLRDAGVTRTYGAALPELEHVAIAEPSLAALLADADGRVGPAPGVAVLPDQVVRISSRPGDPGSEVVVDDPDELAPAVLRATTAGRYRMHAIRLRLELPLDAPAPPDAQPAVLPVLPLDLRLELPDDGVVVLAGPGVVRAGSFRWGGAVDGLRAFAAAAGVGVANTWGAKGVFRWDSPHHLGTVGLQADDFELLGFRDANLVVATGVDRDESADERVRVAPVVDVSPIHLGTAAGNLPRRERAPLPNRLYERLSAIAQPGYVDTSVPLHPARAVADAKAALAGGGVASADPGLAGLWFARTFPTDVLGSVVVPATSAPGIAAAIAFVTSSRGQPAIAVTVGPVDAATEQVIALARARDVHFAVDVWSADGPRLDPDAHTAALHEARTTPGVASVSTGVDLSRTRALVDAAGPVVAWGGIEGPG
jgi:hypothetical protein